MTPTGDEERKNEKENRNEFRAARVLVGSGLTDRRTPSPCQSARSFGQVSLPTRAKARYTRRTIAGVTGATNRVRFELSFRSWHTRFTKLPATGTNFIYLKRVDR